MATGRSTQLTRQVGEHLVAAELGRRGLVAAPFSGNVPLFDLLAADERGNSIPIQVKTINGPSWQFRITQFLDVTVRNGIQSVRGKVPLSTPDLVCIFVLLGKTGEDTFYIFRLGDLQDHFARTYKGGRRPRNPDSMHCAVWPTDLEPHRNRWEVVFEALAGSSSRLRRVAAKPSNKRMERPGGMRHP
jgi:hypothetical protein